VRAGTDSGRDDGRDSAGGVCRDAARVEPDQSEVACKGDAVVSSQYERAPSGTVGCEVCVLVDQGAPRLSNPATG
jgi:hypothetical protein